MSGSPFGIRGSYKSYKGAMLGHQLASAQEEKKEVMNSDGSMSRLKNMS